MNDLKHSTEGVQATPKKSTLQAGTHGARSKLEKTAKFSELTPGVRKQPNRTFIEDGTSSAEKEMKLASQSLVPDSSGFQAGSNKQVSEKDVILVQAAPAGVKDTLQISAVQVSHMQALFLEIGGTASDMNCGLDQLDRTISKTSRLVEHNQSKSNDHSMFESDLGIGALKREVGLFAQDFVSDKKEAHGNPENIDTKLHVNVVKVETHFDFVTSDLHQTPAKILQCLTETPEIFSPVAGNVMTVQRPGQLKSLHIQLQPEDLGELKIVMSLRGKSLSLKMEASSKEAASHLMRDHQYLRDLITKAGFEMADKSIVISVAKEKTSFETPGSFELNNTGYKSDQGQSQFSQQEFGGNSKHDPATKGGGNFRSLSHKQGFRDVENVDQDVARGDASTRYI